jgi:hypothetical protein
LSITWPSAAILGPAAVIAVALVTSVQPARAAEPVTLVLKDHHFTPAELTVPAGVRFRIQVTNQDDIPAEFESSDLRVEKIAAPGASISVMAGPLKPGTYKFFDDYHPDTATGTLTAAAPQG